MALPDLRDDDATSLALEVLAVREASLVEIPVGFGNRSWRVDTERGPFVLKVGPIASAAKWASARVGQRLAARAGVPTPTLVHFSLRDDLVVRAFEWVDGQGGGDLVDDPGAQARLGADLGRAIAALHHVRRVSFSSRFEGSAPTFNRWDDYARHRLSQIEDRARSSDPIDRKVFKRAADQINALALAVTDCARLTLCHRDLHADNLIVDDSGALLAILDWDMAECWDQAGEWFKLDWMLFDTLPGARRTYDEAYDAAHPDRPDWARRCRLVDLLESLNSAVTAPAQGWTSFGEGALDRLEHLLDGS